MSKKILLFTHEHIIGIAGGAEKIFANMSNEFCEKGYEVIAMCDSEKNGRPFYFLDNKVRFVNLRCEEIDDKFLYPSHKDKVEDFICKNFWKETYDEHNDIAQKFEKFINKEKPDLIICYFLPLFREISYCRNYNIPTIIMMHTEPDKNFKFFGKKYFELNKLALNKADCLTVLMKSFKKQAKRYYLGNIEVIGNPTDLIEDAEINISKNKAEKKEKHKISCISRIDKFKRQDILIEAFASIAENYPNWELDLYGHAQPPEFLEKITSLIEKTGKSNQIKYLGITNKVNDVLKETDIFVLPSDFEGFPLSISEAMSMAIPCVGFKDCSGVNELIKSNKTGLLCKKTSEDLAETLKLLIENKELRIKFGQNGLQEIKKYDSKIIWEKWQNLIEKTMNKPVNKINYKIILFSLLLRSVLKSNWFKFNLKFIFNRKR